MSRCPSPTGWLRALVTISRPHFLGRLLRPADLRACPSTNPAQARFPRLCAFGIPPTSLRLFEIILSGLYLLPFHKNVRIGSFISTELPAGIVVGTEQDLRSAGREPPCYGTALTREHRVSAFAWVLCDFSRQGFCVLPSGSFRPLH